MVMIQKNDKAQKIAKKALRNKGISKPKSEKPKKELLTGPYLQH